MVSMPGIKLTDRARRRRIRGPRNAPGEHIRRQDANADAGNRVVWANSHIHDDIRTIMGRSGKHGWGGFLAGFRQLGVT